MNMKSTFAILASVCLSSRNYPDYGYNNTYPEYGYNNTYPDYGYNNTYTNNSQHDNTSRTARIKTRILKKPTSFSNNIIDTSVYSKYSNNIKIANFTNNRNDTIYIDNNDSSANDNIKTIESCTSNNISCEDEDLRKINYLNAEANLLVFDIQNMIQGTNATNLLKSALLFVKEYYKGLKEEASTIAKLERVKQVLELVKKYVQHITDQFIMRHPNIVEAKQAVLEARLRLHEHFEPPVHVGNSTQQQIDADHASLTKASQELLDALQKRLSDLESDIKEGIKDLVKNDKTPLCKLLKTIRDEKLKYPCSLIKSEEYNFKDE